MRKLLVLIIILQSTLLLNAQSTNKWETADTSNILSYGNPYVSSIARSSGYKNNYVRLGMITNMFKESLYSVVQRYSDKSRKLEIVYGDSLHKEFQFWGIHQVNDSIIAVGGDSAYLQCSIWNGTDYQKYYFYTGIIYISKDNGNSWKKKYLDSNKMVGSILMSDDKNGLALATNRGNYYNQKSSTQVLLKTTDCWDTWQEIQLPSTFKGIAYMKLFSKDTLMFVLKSSNGSSLGFSYDGGLTWDKKDLTIFDDYIISSIDFVTSKLAYAFVFKQLIEGSISYSNYFYKTTDGGITWEQYGNINRINSPNWLSIKSQDYFDSLNGLAGGSNGIILRTNDGGLNWIAEDVPFKPLMYDKDVTGIYYPNKDFAIAEMSETFSFVFRGKKALKPPEFYPLYKMDYRPNDKIVLNWKPVKEATKYRLKIDTSARHGNDYSASFYNSLIDTVLIDTSFNIMEIQYSNTYFCWIQSISDTSYSEWGNTFSFKIYNPDSLLINPVIIYPQWGQNIYTDSVNIQWTKISSADSYYLNIYNPNTMEKYFNDTINDNSLSLQNLIPNTIYDIKIISQKNGVRSPAKPGESYFYTYTTLPVLDDLIETKGDFLIYPNPAKNFIDVSVRSRRLKPSVAEDEDIRIYNVLGECVKKPHPSLISAMLNERQGTGVRIDVSDLPTGLYLVRCGNELGRFVKE